MVKVKGFFRLAHLFFANAPEVRSKDPFGFNLKGLVLLVGSPDAEVEADKVGLSEQGVQFSGAIGSLDHG